MSAVTRGAAALKARADGELLRAFQGGDAEAMDALLERYLPTLYGYALKHLPLRAAEDCVNEAIVALIGALPTLEVRDGEVLPLLFSFVHRRAVDWVRQEVRRSALSLEDLEQASDAPDALREVTARFELERWWTCWRAVQLGRAGGGGVRPRARTRRRSRPSSS